MYLLLFYDVFLISFYMRGNWNSVLYKECLKQSLQRIIWFNLMISHLDLRKLFSMMPIINISHCGQLSHYSLECNSEKITWILWRLSFFNFRFSRFLREVGLPAIGFSPMPNTPTLLHDHNEFLNEDIFIKGIDIFVDLIANIASV